MRTHTHTNTYTLSCHLKPHLKLAGSASKLQDPLGLIVAAAAVSPLLQASGLAAHAMLSAKARKGTTLHPTAHAQLQVDCGCSLHPPARTQAEGRLRDHGGLKEGCKAWAWV